MSDLNFVWYKGQWWCSAYWALTATGFNNYNGERKMGAFLADPNLSDPVRQGIRMAEHTNLAGMTTADWLLNHVAADAIGDSFRGANATTRKAFFRNVAADLRDSPAPTALLGAPGKATGALAVRAGSNLAVPAPVAATPAPVTAETITAALAMFDRWNMPTSHEQAWLRSMFGLDDVPVQPVPKSFTAGDLAREHGVDAGVIGKLLKAQLITKPGQVWQEPGPTKVGVYQKMVMINHYDWSLKDQADSIVIAYKVSKASLHRV